MSYIEDPNNKNKDPLAELFRQKLENHRTAVDGDGWNELKKSLGGNKKRTLWIVVSAVSAAIVALLFILSPSDKDPVDTPLQGESTTTIDNRNDEAIAKDLFITPQKEDIVVQSDDKLAVTNKATNASTPLAPVVSKQISTDKEDEVKQKAGTNTVIAGVEPEKENKTNEKSDYVAVAEIPVNPKVEKEEQKQAEEKQVHTGSSLFFEFEEEAIKNKEKKNWTIAAVYGGSTSGNESVENARAPLRMSSFSEEKANSNLLAQTTANRGEGNHFPEMSFSFTVGKRINKRFAVESGITYTYLYSKYDGTESASYYELKQHLHYIGIPVNATVYILGGDSKWNLYASAGTMLEKGIRATYKETVGEMLGQSTTNWGESISGVQWSVNASVGVTYDLSRNFSLFLAPRLSYYFDNNQPESIRTNKDLSFGLNVGLKYNL
jgi:hypothetical protein